MKTTPFVFAVLALFTSGSAFAIFGSDAVQLQTRDRTTCIPQEVQGAIKEVAAKFKSVQVVSAYRPPADNARRGGAKGSQHMQCKAIDFLIPNRSSRSVQKQLQQFLLSIKAKYHLRYNVYCTGRSHIDDNNRGLPDSYSSCVERESWRHGSAKSYTRTRSRPKRRRYGYQYGNGYQYGYGYGY